MSVDSKGVGKNANVRECVMDCWVFFFWGGEEEGEF